MLSRSHRIPSLLVSEVMRRGKHISGDSFQLIMQKNEVNVSRFAFIVSTKIDKRATQRNRIRRILSESVRHLLPTLKEHNDFIVIARKNIATMKQADVEVWVAQLLRKIMV